MEAKKIGSSILEWVNKLDIMLLEKFTLLLVIAHLIIHFFVPIRIDVEGIHKTVDVHAKIWGNVSRSLMGVFDL